MGAGWYERDHTENGFPFLDVKGRVDLLAEQVEIVVRTWTEEGFDHTGEHFTLRQQTALPKPLQQPHPPLILGGLAKPRAVALAARFATEYNTIGTELNELRERRRRLDEACTAIGRDPETLGYSLMTTCVIGADRSEVDERLGRVEEMLGSMRAGTLVGTVDELADRLDELESVGISRVMLQHLDHADLGAVAAMGELAANWSR
jgi:alkanesulfonate monooxygenase SsuD/methylene tetrahydromethanopterin reductase-like flavin-dependent oxidoreductase (luciferase family)